MKKTLSMFLAIMLVAGIVFATHYNTHTDKTRDAETARIGLISSETGDFGPIGKAFSDGVRMAKEEYALAHPDAKIELHAEDDGSDAKKGLSAYTKLTSLNKIDGLINFSSPSINIIYDSVTKTGIPVIQLGEQDREPAADTVYQIYPTQDAPEVATGEYLKGISNGSDSVLFYTNDSTMTKFVRNIRTGYDDKFKEEFKLDLSQKEYATIVAKAMAHNPKYAVVAAYTQNGAGVVRELLKYKNRPTIIFDLTFDPAEYAQALPNLSALDGSLAMSLKENLDLEFAKKYKARYGNEPSIFAGYGYDAFNALMKGYDTDKNIWNKNIATISLHGVTGQIALDEKGLRAPEHAMMKIAGGKKVDMAR